LRNLSLNITCRRNLCEGRVSNSSSANYNNQPTPAGDLQTAKDKTTRMNSSLALLLFGGICLAVFGPAVGVHDIPDNVREHIQKLQVHYNVTSDRALFGSTFLPDQFPPHMFKEEERRLLLLESLEVYIKILTDMLERTQDGQIKASIMAVRARMEHLRDETFNDRERKLKERLQKLKERLEKLWALKTNDATVQRKAVRELESIIQRAYELRNREAGQRRRRHASLAQPMSS
ncbi:hypothetical protein GJAV_G00269010, partial [Gymnothorax javanicus]